MEPVLYVYIEVDSNDADYVGTLKTVYDKEVLNALLKWKNNETLSEDEFMICQDMLPYVEYRTSDELIDNLHRMEFLHKAVID